MVITICTYLLNGKVVGKAPIPAFSEEKVRREIARFLLVEQYDQINLQDFTTPNPNQTRTFDLQNSRESLPIY